METMFEQIGHIYNIKEKWRIEIAKKEIQAHNKKKPDPLD